MEKFASEGFMNCAVRRIGLFTVLLISTNLLLSGCVVPDDQRDGAPKNHPVDINSIPDPIPEKLPKSRFGNPKSYVVFGKRYFVLDSADGYRKKGIASWYGTKFHGRLTSTREPYNMFSMTAASPVLPIPCYARVTNLKNGRSVIVKVNDRGPFAPNRIIDLSYAAATKLGYTKQGTAMVEVEAITGDHPELAAASKRPVYTRKSHFYSASGHPVTKPPQLYLQVAAFHMEANALELKKKLEEITQHKIFIKTVQGQIKMIYKVQIGPLAGIEESDRLLAEIIHLKLGNPITVIG